jgi:hypothetical protein
LTNVEKYVIIKDCGYILAKIAGPLHKTPLTKKQKCGIIKAMKKEFINNLSKNPRLACLNLIDYTKSVYYTTNPPVRKPEKGTPLVGGTKKVQKNTHGVFGPAQF